MTTRRTFLVVIGAAALMAVRLAEAKSSGKIPRISFLSSTNPVGTPHYAAFLEGLREYGYIEGKNIVIEHRWTDRNLDKLPELAAELVQMQVDLIIAWSSHSVAAAKKATSKIPIVMVSVSDPVASGFVTNLAQPGGNITGMTNMHRATTAKSMEMLKEMAPGIRRLGVLRVPANPGHVLLMNEAEEAKHGLGLELHVADVNSRDDIDNAFAVLRKLNTDGLLILGDQMFMGQRQHIADLALMHRLPSITIFRQYPEAGGLMSYGFNSTDLFRRLASYVDRILKGAKPGDLPVEHPTTFELVINHKTARALGLAIPGDVLLRANRVIE